MGHVKVFFYISEACIIVKVMKLCYYIKASFSFFKRVFCGIKILILNSGAKLKK